MPVGLFGKYPGKRDFIAHNLPIQILRPLEDWFQAGVAASRQLIGTHWQDRFLVQPFWNFRLGSAIVGTDCLGTFMPSVDGVGRYFPLCAVGWPDETEMGYPISAIFENEDWLASIQARLMATLDGGDLPGPDHIIEGFAAPQALALRNPGLLKMEAETLSDPLLRTAQISLYAAELSQSEMSIWWTSGGSSTSPLLIAAKGMPDPYVFAQMMGDDGRDSGPRPR
jgi:type VI secretion system protein ImpM